MLGGCMPLVEIAVMKDYFSKEEKKRLAKAVKDVVMDEIKAMRNQTISTWVFVREVDVMEKSE
jgi:phenylpyruvate tautomerase PptA (4-oxalocrotonate tautomerase family)